MSRETMQNEAKVINHQNGIKHFLGSDIDQGNHWFNGYIKKKLPHALNLLSWHIPDALTAKVKEISSILKFGNVNRITIECVHDPAAHKDGCKSCGFVCIP